ncbi:hypothetical protein U1Q18_010295 [Sarracenia purpurea var. burkii]
MKDILIVNERAKLGFIRHEGLEGPSSTCDERHIDTDYSDLEGDDGLTSEGNFTPFDKDFVKVAEWALIYSPLGVSSLSDEQIVMIETRLGVNKDQMICPSSPLEELANEALESRVSPVSVGQKFPAKLSEVFSVAQGVEGEQGEDEDDEEAEDEIEVSDLMIRATEHDKAMAN